MVLNLRKTVASTTLTTSSASISASLPTPKNLSLIWWSDSGTLGDGFTASGYTAFTGSALAGSTVTLSWVSSTGARGTLAPVTADWSGSFTAGGTLPEGTYTLTAIAKKAGQTSAASSAFALTIDRTPPAAPTMSAAADGSSITVSGTAEKNAFVYVYMDNSASTAALVKANASGIWTATVSSLAEGTHTFLALARDMAGNWSPVSPMSSARVSMADKVTVVAAPVIDPASGGITNDTTPTLKGTAAAGTVVSIYLDGSSAALGTTTAGAGGVWSFKPTAAVTDGTHSFVARAADAQGHISTASGAVSLLIDHIAPNAPVVNAFAAGVLASSTPQVSGNAEANATVAVYVDGSATASGTVKADATGQWSYVPGSALADGTHSFAAKATDLAGNVSALSTSKSVTIAHAVPNAPVIAPFGTSLTNDSTPLVKGTAAAGATVSVLMDGSATPLTKVVADAGGNWSFDTIIIGDGSHSFRATATDSLGAVSGLSAAQSLTIDTTPPTAKVASLVVAGDNVIDTTEAGAATLKITGSLSQALSSGDSLLLTVGGSTFSVAAANIAGTTFSVDVAKPSAGWSAGSVSAHVEDAAHNASAGLSQSYSIAIAPPSSTGFLMGINIAGGEFGSVGGAYGSNYIYPQHNEIDYYKAKGLDVIRVPFLWERLQTSQFGQLDATELSRLDDVVNYATSKGLKVVLDSHNYASAFGNLIGSAGTSNAAFADFWGKVASHYAGNSSVIFGLMNEPNQQAATTWLASANAAIDSIRKAGATNEVLVPGSYWDGAWTWTSSDNASVIGTGVKDPLKNFAFEVHQYLDYDGSGTHAAVVSSDVGVQRLTAITQWAEQTGNKLFLGEFGVASDATSLAALDKMLAYMEQHTGAWQGGTYWAGGPWWGNYMYSAEPSNGVDKPQLAILQQHANQVV